jgi:hypothetical protein
MKLGKLQASLVLLFCFAQYEASVFFIGERAKETIVKLMPRVAAVKTALRSPDLMLLQRPTLTLRGGVFFLSCDAR